MHVHLQPLLTNNVSSLKHHHHQEEHQYYYSAKCGHKAKSPGVASRWLPGRFIRGSWTSLNRSWHLPSTSSTLARHLVHGKRIMFHGDSITRQLFLRLVWHYRGNSDTIIEHHFHQNAFFVANATHDALIIQDFDPRKEYLYNVIFHCFFVWDPDGQTVRELYGASLYIVPTGRRGIATMHLHYYGVCRVILDQMLPGVLRRESNP